MKSRKIAISGPILRLCQNDALKQNSPLVQLSGTYWLWKCTVTRLSSLQFSLHKSQFTKYYFYFPTEQIPNRLIPNPLI
uniref:Uncharacterized protein n=1 Tax=Populus trichocarpa TaxID=3694 RepID=A0A3N7FAW6_POPTR